MRAAPIALFLGVVIVVTGCAQPGRPLSAALTPHSAHPTAEPALHVDGLAMLASTDRVRARLKPGRASKPAERELEPGVLLFVTAGPEEREGAEWWQVQPDRLEPGFGWVRAEALTPVTPECPAIETITIDALMAIAWNQALACYGDTPIAFEATVQCAMMIVDGGPGGASWMDSYRGCHTDGDPGLALFGGAITSGLGEDLTANPITHRYRITGHFDDPEATRCWNVPVGVNLDARGRPEPDAVIACRERFVVTEAISIS